MLDKARIRKSFSRAARTYDDYAGFQELMAKSLVDFLSLHDGVRFKRILDVGCATGQVAGSLHKKFPSAHVVALDISMAMLLKAREKSLDSGASGTSERPEFIVSDFEALPFKDGSFDLAASNLTYQWATDLAGAFNELYRVLAPGGLVLMNTLVSGTLSELQKSFSEAEALLNKSDKRPFMSFVEPDILKAHIEASGLEIVSFEERTYAREYSSMRELLRVLKNIGAANPLSEPRAPLTTKTLLKEAEEYYKSHFPSPGSNGVQATYNTVFVTAKNQKPNRGL